MYPLSSLFNVSKCETSAGSPSSDMVNRTKVGEAAMTFVAASYRVSAPELSRFQRIADVLS